MMNEYVLALSNGEKVPVTVRTSVRARRIRLQVTDAGAVVLVLPLRADLQSALEFLHTQKNWVEKVLKRTPLKKNSPLPPREIQLEFTGEKLGIVYEPQDVVWTGVRYRNAQELLVSGNTAEPAACFRALREWLVRKAKVEIFPFAADICSELDFRVNEFSIALQRSAWGRCSSKGKMTLNAALLFFPREIVRYVVIHEGCHLKEMNHSIRFWNLVRRYYPYPDHARRILNGRSGGLPAWVCAKE